MEEKTEIVIHDYKVDPLNGGIEVHLKTKRTEGNNIREGRPKIYGCDRQMLRDRFNGNLEEFEAWAAREHGKLTGASESLKAQVAARKGKVIG